MNAAVIAVIVQLDQIAGLDPVVGKRNRITGRPASKDGRQALLGDAQLIHRARANQDLGGHGLRVHVEHEHALAVKQR